MQVQTQLSWSERIAATIIQQCDGDGYHAFPSGRWAYVEGMTLMAMARTGQYYGKQEYQYKELWVSFYNTLWYTVVGTQIGRAHV